MMFDCIEKPQLQLWRHDVCNMLMMKEEGLVTGNSWAASTYTSHDTWNI